eukprot:gnl/TRDRNA2_/TRDRNA2_173778_c0_seq1.p1 gnl/TRDRNA2_/TRDRNA2_173778_c0~~gnl/TRDRNA2_/TRDRNA2_173778_c0_seq1.p1  ORF type:complete len:1255 (-),score=308.74 gnl/TRDRNA2_/TRDRNA2_173778_c0_seq1:103-3867(-)
MPAMKSSRRKVRKSGMKSKSDDGGGGGKRRSKSIEQTYQKKTQVEHILLRPDTYVGSVEKQDDELWVWDSAKGEMVFKGISYVPALYKIFDEILVNAADNLQRDKSMSEIKVDIDTKSKRIKVWNNGKGLPIAIHKKHKVYVPELVFGHLLTSDNYDDSEKKVTGGRNGFGAKLTNIFSTKFIIETAGGGKRYKQEWKSNMGRKGKPEIKKYSGSPYTCVEFWPDLDKFGMSSLEADTVALMQKRVYDVAGTSGDRIKVHLNGKKVPIKTFADYCEYFHSGEGHAHAHIGKRWEVLVARSDGDGFNQCSFVNAISTPKGGTHVQYVVDQLVDAIQSKASKQHKGSEIKRVLVKNHLWVFINCLIENPAFSSQTKECMTLKASNFGSKCDLPKSFIDEVLAKTDIINAVVTDAQAKMIGMMDKAGSKGARGKRVLGIPKLEDANEAGGKNASECTLILTEGDSAKALAVAGLSVVGRDHFGVFPLRGKLLNVRDVTQRQVMENKEIMAIVKILGLTFGQSGAGKDLRYGAVMIMADQDHDGSHIKGLLINFFHHWWPKLLQSDFVQEFVTPIVKATKGTEVKQFFTQTEYEKWRKDGTPGWSIKYYKGLGTSTAAEAKQYFTDIDNHRLDFSWKNKKDGELIDMAFSKHRADDRKKWMNSYKEGAHVDHSKDSLTYDDFVNKELVQFARYDLMRSVPSVMDGLKPTQRKVLYCCFKRGLRSDVKVAQLIGYVGEHSAYHHGEASLGGTIVAMAQDFVGSNNINLLVPSGQFGTRLQGGKDSASTRYIYTRLHPVARLVFSPLDDAVLNYLDEEGQKIEPYWYAPIIPWVLVNGAEGIGTGWSTSVPNYDPRAVIENCRRYIKSRPMQQMRPWYRGFTGAITPAGKGKYESHGVVTETVGRKESIGNIEITELPLRKWTQDFKEFLYTMMPGSETKTKIQLQDVREHHTERNVHFIVKMKEEEYKKMKGDSRSNMKGVEASLRLTSSLSETNMVLFNHEGKIQKYKNAVEIMKEFCKVRLQYYDRRKKYLIGKLTLEKSLLSNRARFIGMIIKRKLHINNRKKADICKDLTRLRFDKFGDRTPPRTGFEYLLIMQIASLTKERKEELERMLKEKTAELNKVKKTSIRAMWTYDLDVLEAAVNKMYADTGDDGPIGDQRKPRPKFGEEAAKDKDGKPGKGKKGKLLKAFKVKKGKGRKRRRSDDDEDKKGEDKAEEADPEVALDNPFTDMSRWTMAAISKVSAKVVGGGPTGKRRRS